MERQDLLKKLSAMAAALLAAHGLANAQVIINDIQDSTLALNNNNSISMNIDLNNDGQADFSIAIKKDTRVSITTYTTRSYSTFSTSNGGITQITNTIIVTNTFTYTLYKYGLKPLAKKAVKAFNNGAIFSNTNNYIKPINSNIKIFTTQTFKNNNASQNLRYITILSGVVNTKGKFQTGQDKFIGVKFYDASNNSYVGWIKINILGNHSLKVEKWAYEKTADSIVTGTTPYYLAVKDTTSDGATIAIKPKFNGKVHYVVIDSTAPNPNWQQIINGQDGNGNPAALADSVNITNAPDTAFINILGLGPDAPYRFCMISADTQGNKDRDVFTLDFRTKQATSTQADELQNTNLSLYPNPARDFVQIRGNAAVEKVEVLDLTGRTVKTYTGKEIQSMNVSNIPAGLYSVRITTAQGTITRKLIKY